MARGRPDSDRDKMIVRMRAQGHSVALLASTFGLTERHIRRILRAHLSESRSFFEGTANERLSHLLELHDSVIEDAAVAAMDATSAKARVDALMLKLTALTKKQALLDELGLLPHFAPPSLDHAGDLGEAFVRLLQKHDAVSPALVDELPKVLDAWRTGQLGSYPFEP